MIYTLTCNPALDYAVRLDKFREGAINRSYGESIAPGGKGVNVSLVLKNLGVPTLAMGVAAGFTGEVLLEMLEARGVPTDFLRADGFTRINVKLKSARETDINGSRRRSPPCRRMPVSCSRAAFLRAFRAIFTPACSRRPAGTTCALRWMRRARCS